MKRPRNRISSLFRDMPTKRSTRRSRVMNKSFTIRPRNKYGIFRLFDELEPSTTVTLPRAGYLIEAAHAQWVARKLALHGIRYQIIPRAMRAAAVSTFRWTIRVRS